MIPWERLQFLGPRGIRNWARIRDKPARLEDELRWSRLSDYRLKWIIKRLLALKMPIYIKREFELRKLEDQIEEMKRQRDILRGEERWK